MKPISDAQVIKYYDDYIIFQETFKVWARLYFLFSNADLSSCHTYFKCRSIRVKRYLYTSTVYNRIPDRTLSTLQSDGLSEDYKIKAITRASLVLTGGFSASHSQS